MTDTLQQRVNGFFHHQINVLSRFVYLLAAKVLTACEKYPRVDKVVQ